ncbi:MAG: 3'-5' exonuclease [Zhengella sp.]|uniref:3'-5' exonuclease n=1 Tax=Zhengella sp. TaxID=2282762 RepID=UPI003527C247
MDSSFAAGTIALLVRSERELPRAQRAIAASRMPAVHPFLMHDAKGREFRAVAIMAADADVIPSEERLLAATDEQSLREIFDTERHLLYVAATRAREGLWISACDPVSEFLEDLLG